MIIWNWETNEQAVSVYKAIDGPIQVGVCALCDVRVRTVTYKDTSQNISPPLGGSRFQIYSKLALLQNHATAL